jgi:nucleoside-diphosphate-sugar epimerase
MKILVTGSSGFVGKALCEHIRKHGDTAIEFDLPEGDILNCDSLSRAISECDMVVHCAAQADLNKFGEDIGQGFQVNIVGTYNVAQSCAIQKKKLVYISTCCAWGTTTNEKQLVEDVDLPRPTEPYAHSKYAGESIVKMFDNLKWVILRIGTVYGPGMRKELFNYIAIDKIYNNEVICVHGTGRQTRQYVFIDDLVDGIYRACVCESIDYVCSICSNEQVSVLDTIRVAETIIGKRAITKIDNDRRGQILNENISNARSINGLGCKYTPYVMGMARTILWYRDNHTVNNPI